MKIGDYNTLRIKRLSTIGLFLEDEHGEEVLLPQRYVEDGMKQGDEITVFVYRDNAGRPIATTLRPAAKVGDFAMLRCKQVGPSGAFMDIGLMKDLLVPHANQHTEMKPGEAYLTYVYLDRASQRLVGTTKLNVVLSANPTDLNEGDQVEAVAWYRDDNGWRVVVNGEYLGMVYHNQLFEEMEVGKSFSAFVNRIREDGKIDLLIQRPGHGNIDDTAEKLLRALKLNDGFIGLNDNSAPEEIKSQLNMSKKSFKKAVGRLYKLKQIKLEENGIKLLK
ncbi:MAG: S1-like domain-containing RNA-binding protein [Salibacteraceae bacterium]